MRNLGPGGWLPDSSLPATSMSAKCRLWRGPLMGTVVGSGGEESGQDVQEMGLTGRCSRHGLLPPLPRAWLTPRPSVQTLHRQTMEALDHMLQTFLTQNPTADELHSLLSVRGAGCLEAGAGGSSALAWEPQGGCPRGSRAWPVASHT